MKKISLIFTVAMLFATISTYAQLNYSFHHSTDCSGEGHQSGELNSVHTANGNYFAAPHKKPNSIVISSAHTGTLRLRFAGSNIEKSDLTYVTLKKTNTDICIANYSKKVDHANYSQRAEAIGKFQHELDEMVWIPTNQTGQLIEFGGNHCHSGEKSGSQMVQLFPIESEIKILGERKGSFGLWDVATGTNINIKMSDNVLKGETEVYHPFMTIQVKKNLPGFTCFAYPKAGEAIVNDNYQVTRVKK